MCGIHDRNKRTDISTVKERLTLRNKVKEEEQLENYLRGVKRRNRNGNLFQRSNGLRQNAETAISCCRGPGPARKKE